MSVQTNGDGAQAATPGTPGQGQAPNPTPDQQGQGQAPAQGQQAGQPTAAQAQQVADAISDDTPLDQLPEAIRGYVAHLRQEAARHRTAAREAQEQVQQFQRQNETEQERQQREQAEARERLERLEQENRDLKVGSAFQAAAQQAKAHSPTAVWELVKARGLTVETDDNGKPTNAEAIIAALQQSDPYLFARPALGADGGTKPTPGGGTPPTGTDINSIIRGRAQRAR